MGQDFIPKGEKPLVKIGTAIANRAPITDVGFALPDFFQVKATQQGFIHWLRNPGDIFMIPRHLYSPTWMEIMDHDVATIVAGSVTMLSADQARKLLK